MTKTSTYQELERKVRQQEKEISRLKGAEEELTRSYDTQEVIRQLIDISLEDISLTEILQRCLDTILGLPWLSLEASGAIHIVADEPDVLKVVARSGLASALIVECSRVPFGRCLCGLAASTQEMQFADCIDHRHELRFDGMKDHGHYCAPILYSGRTLGVLNIYTKAHHKQDLKEVEFLHVISSILADIIVRKTAEKDQKRSARLNAANEDLMNTLDQLQKTQAQLVQSEKMASLGSLVAGVAHEINTPVGVAFTASTHLEKETQQLVSLYKKGEMKRNDFEDYLTLCQESTRLLLANLNRAGELIRSFKQVAIDQTGEAKRNFNLREYIEEVLLSLRPILKKTKLSVTVEGDDALELWAYPGAFSQILTNLVTNSLTHAFGEKKEGMIFIRFSRENSLLHFSFSDNGKGIDAKNQTHVFEPFFTTNREKGGGGLGLHIIYNLVTQKLNGSIDFHSEPGKGTTFDITIPMGQKPYEGEHTR